MGDCLYIVIPAYNEEETIRQVVDDWYPVVEKAGAESRLVIINDGSRDSTYKTLCECAKTHPALVPMTKENSGHGSTLLHGYHYALQQNADYIFQTDSDGQTLPDEFAAFWEQRERYDMLIGYRNKREDGFSRVVVTKVLKFVIKLCFKVSVKDANTPFRLMKAKTLEAEIAYVPEDFFLSNVLLTVLFTKHGRRLFYIPITFRPRQGGKNSINLRRIFKIGRQSLSDFRELNKKIERDRK